MVLLPASEIHWIKGEIKWYSHNLFWTEKHIERVFPVWKHRDYGRKIIQVSNLWTRWPCWRKCIVQHSIASSFSGKHRSIARRRECVQREHWYPQRGNSEDDGDPRTYEALARRVCQLAHVVFTRTILADNDKINHFPLKSLNILWSIIKNPLRTGAFIFPVFI